MRDATAVPEHVSGRFPQPSSHDGVELWEAIPDTLPHLLPGEAPESVAGVEGKHDSRTLFIHKRRCG